MKWNGLILAGALVLVADAFVLTHVARNRSGQPEAEITLTDRELRYWRQSDDSGVQLTLQIAQQYGMGHEFLDEKKLVELGFDTSFDPSAKDAWNHYSRMAAREAFVAFELAGAGFELFKEQRRKQGETSKQKPEEVERDLENSSRLVAVDAARTAAELRTKYPDRNRVLILPAVVRIQIDSTPERARLRGWINDWPSMVHVPRPFSDQLRPLDMSGPKGEPRFEITLAYGRLLEPWVVAVNVPQR